MFISARTSQLLCYPLPMATLIRPSACLDLTSLPRGPHRTASRCTARLPNLTHLTTEGTYSYKPRKTTRLFLIDIGSIKCKTSRGQAPFHLQIASLPCTQAVLLRFSRLCFCSHYQNTPTGFAQQPAALFSKGRCLASATPRASSSCLD